MVGPEGVDRPVGQRLPQRLHMPALPQRRRDQVPLGVGARVTGVVEQQMVQADFGDDGRAPPPARQPHLVDGPRRRQVHEIAGRARERRDRERARHRLFLDLGRPGVGEDPGTPAARAAAGPGISVAGPAAGPGTPLSGPAAVPSSPPSAPPTSARRDSATRASISGAFSQWTCTSRPSPARARHQLIQPPGRST